MSSLLQQNKTNLQEILNTINSLPEAENLDTEISTQSTLLSEQDAKIAELAQVLVGKAGGGSGVEIETYTGVASFSSLHLGGDPAIVYYTDASMTLRMFEMNFDSGDKVIEIAKNTIIFVKNSVFSIDVTNIESLNDDYTALLPISGGFTIEFS